MLTLIMHHGVTLAACVLLGVATSWWMFRGDRAARTAPKDEGEES